MPGWKSSIAKCNAYESLPENARKYVETIEKYLSIPGNFLGPQIDAVNYYFYFQKMHFSYVSFHIFVAVKWIGVGPARDAIIVR